LTVPVEFEDAPNVDTYYEKASQIANVGLACKPFFEHLCPTYVDDWPLPGQDDLETRLQRLRKMKLFAPLKNGLSIEVNFVNPYCDYANERAREESQFNTRCREDLHRGIDALKCLAGDLEQARSTGDFKIKGEVEVWLMRCNPYVSYTQISFADGRPDLLRVGFLLFQRRGADGPAIRLNQQTQGIWEAFHTHKASLRGRRDFLFSWRGDRVDFREEFPKPGGYNAFFSYNRQDAEEVARVGAELYRRGLVYWQDTRALVPGQQWEGAIQKAIVKCPAALVFFGRHGLGYWQVREIDLLLNRKREDQDFEIIPVILRGGVVPPDLVNQITPFNLVHVRDKGGLGHIGELAQVIRRANGFG
jgi:TIR domain